MYSLEKNTLKNNIYHLSKLPLISYPNTQSWIGH
jgi:hypothetical protein